MDKATKKQIEACAWDATVGCGNDSSIVRFAPLQLCLKREPTQEECRVFHAAWMQCLTEMAFP